MKSAGESGCHLSFVFTQERNAWLGSVVESFQSLIHTHQNIYSINIFFLFLLQFPNDLFLSSWTEDEPKEI